MRCPIDNAELIMTDRNGVEIDYCPTCRGVWLDRGELDKIIERAAARPLRLHVRLSARTVAMMNATITSAIKRARKVPCSVNCSTSDTAGLGLFPLLTQSPLQT